MNTPPLRHGVLLTIAYEGTGFCGWQKQPDRRTAQGVVEDAIARMAGHPVALRGASRTDAGVHALGQCAAFSTEKSIAAEGWVQGLNIELPDDVAIRSAAVCAPDYNPRFDAVDKSYRYLLWPSLSRLPQLRRDAWHVVPAMAKPWPSRSGARARLEDWLNLGAMRQAAAILEGTHDFRAFRAADDDRENTVRTLLSVRVVEQGRDEGATVVLNVTGSAFLRNMVRVLTGTLVAVGAERLRPDDVARLLEPGAARADAGMTAPAHGLTLVHVTLGRSAR